MDINMMMNLMVGNMYQKSSKLIADFLSAIRFNSGVHVNA